MNGGWRTGVDIDEVHAVAYLRDFGGEAVRSTSKYIDRQAQIRSMATQFSNIDIHSSGIFATERREWRGVDRDGGDATKVIGFETERRGAVVRSQRHDRSFRKRRADLRSG